MMDFFTTLGKITLCFIGGIIFVAVFLRIFYLLMMIIIAIGGKIW